MNSSLIKKLTVIGVAALLLLGLTWLRGNSIASSPTKAK